MPRAGVRVVVRAVFDLATRMRIRGLNIAIVPIYRRDTVGWGNVNRMVVIDSVEEPGTVQVYIYTRGERCRWRKGGRLYDLSKNLPFGFTAIKRRASDLKDRMSRIRDGRVRQCIGNELRILLRIVKEDSIRTSRRIRLLVADNNRVIRYMIGPIRRGLDRTHHAVAGIVIT